MADNPVMLVTGASKGIGLGVAQYFVSRGYTVCGCSRGPAGWSDGSYEHTSLDVSDEKSVIAWVRQSRAKFKKLDVLVSNAGLVPAAQPLSLTSGETWQKVMRTNLDGTFYACREVAKVMTAQRSGRIITISSMAAALHIEGAAAYAASKSAIVEMTKVLARELAPAGVTCNVVGVSVADTDALGVLGEGVVRKALEKLTFKRPVSIAEISHAIEFFCSSQSSAITGQVLQLGVVT